MVRRKITKIAVEDVEKRRSPSKHYVFVIMVNWSDGTEGHVYRRYSKFFELQCHILDSFPVEAGMKDPSQRIIPFLPGKILLGRSNVRDVALKRLEAINEYCQELIKLPAHISQYKDVLNFFETRPEDIKNLTVDLPFPVESPTIEEISEPLQLEQYVAVGDYGQEARDEVSLVEGQLVEVLEKNESGWWFVNVEDSQGWVPSSYLERQDESTESRVTATLPPGEGEAYMCHVAYRAREKDEVSLDRGCLVEVTEKNLDGWWMVSYDGQKGFAPATNLIKVDIFSTKGPKSGTHGAVKKANNITSTGTHGAAKKPNNIASTGSHGAARKVENSAIPGNHRVGKAAENLASSDKPRVEKIGEKSTSSGTHGASSKAENLTSCKPSRRPVPPPPTPDGDTYENVFQIPGQEAVSLKEKMDKFLSRSPTYSKEYVMPPRKQAVGKKKVPPPRPAPPRIMTQSQSIHGGGRRMPPAVPRAKVSYVTKANFQIGSSGGLNFSKGQEVEVLEKTETGWWMVKIGEKEGLVPVAYLEEKKIENLPKALQPSDRPSAQHTDNRKAGRPQPTGSKSASAVSKPWNMGKGDLTPSREGSVGDRRTIFELKDNGGNKVKAESSASGGTSWNKGEELPLPTVRNTTFLDRAQHKIKSVNNRLTHKTTEPNQQKEQAAEESIDDNHAYDDIEDNQTPHYDEIDENPIGKFPPQAKPHPPEKAHLPARPHPTEKAHLPAKPHPTKKPPTSSPLSREPEPSVESDIPYGDVLLSPEGLGPKPFQEQAKSPRPPRSPRPGVPDYAFEVPDPQAIVNARRGLKPTQPQHKQSPTEVFRQKTHQQSATDGLAPKPHKQSPADGLGPKPHKQSPEAVLGPKPHKQSPAAGLGPKPHKQSATDDLGPKPHKQSAAAVLGPKPHKQSAEAGLGPKPHKQSPAAGLGPKPHKQSPADGFRPKPYKQQGADDLGPKPPVIPHKHNTNQSASSGTRGKSPAAKPEGSSPARDRTKPLPLPRNAENIAKPNLPPELPPRK